MQDHKVRKASVWGNAGGSLTETEDASEYKSRKSLKNLTNPRTQRLMATTPLVQYGTVLYYLFPH